MHSFPRRTAVNNTSSRRDWDDKSHRSKRRYRADLLAHVERLRGGTWVVAEDTATEIVFRRAGTGPPLSWDGCTMTGTVQSDEISV